MAIGDVLSDLGSFSNPFGVPSQGQWNLARGVYTDNVTGQSIVFFFESRKGEDSGQKTAIDQISDTGGRRIAVYEYPYRDGQRLSDLGRKGETFTFNIKFFGINYQLLFQQFLNVVVNSRNQGTIIHPVRGAVKVRFSDYEFVHKYDEWNAITIKAVFKEDNTDALASTNVQAASPDSALRSALQTLTNVQSAIQQNIFEINALRLLPGAIINSLTQRLGIIVASVSGLLGTLAATFSTDQILHGLATQAQGSTGGITSLTAGTTADGTLPPVYQVGFDPTTQAQINSQTDSFVNANKVTPAQAVFAANQNRQAITAAINQINDTFQNDGYPIVLQYTALSISIQEAVESSISAAQQLVTVYVVPRAMSLRQIAKNNGLDPDRQNDIEMLNPYLPSVNYIPEGTQVVVPAS